MRHVSTASSNSIETRLEVDDTATQGEQDRVRRARVPLERRSLGDQVRVDQVIDRAEQLVSGTGREDQLEVTAQLGCDLFVVTAAHRHRESSGGRRTFMRQLTAGSDQLVIAVGHAPNMSSSPATHQYS